MHKHAPLPVSQNHVNINYSRSPPCSFSQKYPFHVWLGLLSLLLIVVWFDPTHTNIPYLFYILLSITWLLFLLQWTPKSYGLSFSLCLKHFRARISFYLFFCVRRIVPGWRGWVLPILRQTRWRPVLSRFSTKASTGPRFQLLGRWENGRYQQVCRHNFFSLLRATRLDGPSRMLKLWSGESFRSQSANASVWSPPVSWGEAFHPRFTRGKRPGNVGSVFFQIQGQFNWLTQNRNMHTWSQCGDLIVSLDLNVCVCVKCWLWYLDLFKYKYGTTACNI